MTTSDEPGLSVTSNLGAGDRTEGRAGFGAPPPPRACVAHYVLQDEIGRGGQGVVYRATDPRLGRRVAIKLLRDLPAGDAADLTLARFRREAATAARLDDPHICAVYDTGVDAGVPYIVMRLVEGASLARHIADALAGGGRSLRLGQDSSARPSAAGVATPPARTAAEAAGERPAISRLLHLVERTARALHALHEAGVIHRDVKPGNIMVTPEGAPVLMDFGLAHDDTGTAPTLTVTGDLFGTPSYMSPEQLSRGTLRVDRRTDVWSLGAALYEALTLRRPFESPTREGLYQAILLEEPQDPRRLNPAVSADLAVVLETALSKDRERRYQTAEALAEDLRRVREHEPILARPVGFAGRAWRWARRRPARAAVALLLALGVPLVTGLAVWIAVNQPRLDRLRAEEQARVREDALTGAYLQLSDGNEGAAITQFRAVVAEDPENVEALSGLVLALQKARHLDDALAVIDSHAVLEAGQPGLSLLRADTLHLLGRHADAAAIEKVARPPTDAIGSFIVGTVEVARGIRGQDRAALLRGHRLLLQAVLLAGPARPSFHMELLRAAALTGDAAAVDASCVAIEHHWGDRARAWFQIAFARNLLHDVPAAERAYRHALELNDHFVEAHVNLANLLWDNGRRDEAMAALRRAIDVTPDTPQIRNNYGSFLHELGDDAAAISQYERALAVDPNHGGAHHNLAVALQTQGRFELAIIEYRRAIKLKPDYIEPYRSVAVALQTTGRLDDAVAAYRESLSLQPDGAFEWCNLGLVLRDLGRLNESVEALAKGDALGGKRPGWRLPSAQMLARGREMAGRQAGWLPLLERGAAPENPAEMLPMARLGLAHGMHAGVLKVLGDDLATISEPAELAAAGRSGALALAARAALGVANTADATAAAALRARALDWLATSAATWERLMAATPPPRRGEMLRIVGGAHWASECAVVRDADALARLPIEERRAWTALWQRCAALTADPARAPSTRPESR